MRSIPSALQAQIASGAATLCHCWKLTRHDGVVMGFTDHDRDLSFDGVTFRAGTGLSATDAEAQLGLSAAATEVTGALSAAAITEADIAAGKYDGAEIEVWLVDWRDVANRVLLRTATLGRVRRGEVHFEAELRTLAARLQQRRGRLYAAGCDAGLGDARCGVDLTDPAWHGAGTVQAVHGANVHVSGLSGFAAGFFTHGRFEVTSGAAAGFAVAVLAHRLAGADAVLTLAAVPPVTLATGDAVKAVAGCDRSFTTCREKFANSANFRGFPHMPGNDFAVSYPAPGDDGLDGGSMNND